MVRLRMVASKAEVIGVAIGSRAVLLGRTVPGAKYKLVDQDGREFDHKARIELEVPFGEDYQALYAEVTLTVPIEIE